MPFPAIIPFLAALGAKAGAGAAAAGAASGAGTAAAGAAGAAGLGAKLAAGAKIAGQIGNFLGPLLGGGQQQQPAMPKPLPNVMGSNVPVGGGGFTRPSAPGTSFDPLSPMLQRRRMY